MPGEHRGQRGQGDVATRDHCDRSAVDGDLAGRLRPAARELPRSLPPLMPNSLTGAHPEFRSYEGSIAYRLPKTEDYPVFSKLPIDLFVGYLSGGGASSSPSGRRSLPRRTWRRRCCARPG